jgi:hypothetical protein
MADSATPIPDLAAAVARTRRLMALLHELTETGMELARGLRREVMSTGASAGVEIRFCRIAKAVRQLIALEAKLDQALGDVASGRWAAEDAERELAALTTSEDAAIEAIETAVREAGDAETAERLRERLDVWHAESSVERDFTEKSVAEIVVDACRRLDIAPDPALLTDEAMTQTLADAVRAYAAALHAAPDGQSSIAGEPDACSPPTLRRPNPIAEPRPPPA